MGIPIFTNIESKNLEDEIVQNLRTAIISGQFEPGTHLNETDISRQMAVSRIPVREALKKLEQMGLAVRQPKRGAFVVTFTEKDVREVFSLRANLESFAFEWAIPNITQKDMEILRGLVKSQQKAISSNDHNTLANLDMQFHEFFCTKANHSRLLKTWYEQHDQCQMLLNLRFRYMANYTSETVPHDHDEILSAIERKDIKRAVALTLEISERVAQECVETLKTFVMQGLQEEV